MSRVACSCGSAHLCPCGSGRHPGWHCRGYGCSACAWSQVARTEPQRDPDGTLDEVSFDSPRGVVLERMSLDHVQLRVERSDGKFVHVELHAEPFDDPPLDDPDHPEAILEGRVEVDP